MERNYKLINELEQKIKTLNSSLNSVTKSAKNAPTYFSTAAFPALDQDLNTINSNFDTKIGKFYICIL